MEEHPRTDGYKGQREKINEDTGAENHDFPIFTKESIFTKYVEDFVLVKKKNTARSDSSDDSKYK